MVCSPWFHGSITTRESEQLLRSKSAGTFLVRFSTTSSGYYVISKVVITNNSKVIHHQRFYHDVLSDCFVIKKNEREDISFETLSKLVESLQQELYLTQPCLGSPFTDLLIPPGENVKAYV
eukprot:TRINITY_DN10252_c0_g1_i1.p1 TRINITY_DN10252_c0_g1~~TRINITY_DN10252_c0_g1_i1.p1  ORF type:complete len:121 (+),score=21.11 TRINITY_DN10252_c0_g1_i1:3-365(+)